MIFKGYKATRTVLLMRLDFKIQQARYIDKFTGENAINKIPPKYLKIVKQQVRHG